MLKNFQRDYPFTFFEQPRIVSLFQRQMRHLRALSHSLEKHLVVLVLLMNVGFNNPHDPQPEAKKTLKAPPLPRKWQL